MWYNHLYSHHILTRIDGIIASFGVEQVNVFVLRLTCTIFAVAQDKKNPKEIQTHGHTQADRRIDRYHSVSKEGVSGTVECSGRGDYHIVPEHIRNIPIASATEDMQNKVAEIVLKIIDLKRTQQNTSILETEIDKIVYSIQD